MHRKGFRVKKKLHNELARRKRNLGKRLKRKLSARRKGPAMAASNVQYEMSGRINATVCGGLPAVHQAVRKTGLDRAINEGAALLKQHRPYFDSDHVLAIAYTVLCGGTCIEDLKAVREDTALLDALGASRLPAPSTAGDYLRRFETQEQIDALQDVINIKRRELWLRQDEEFRSVGIINVDGTLAPTTGEHKLGTDFAYDGSFGYHPLVVSLHNTREPLFLLNRSGNSVSHGGSPHYIDRALDLAAGVFREVCLRGDTDFSLTEHLDDWDRKCTFVLGVDARSNMVELAESLDETQWEQLERGPKYEIRTQPRQTRPNVKTQKVRERRYKNLRLCGEQVADFDYKPGKCEKTYRIVVLRKNISVERGDDVLFDEIRYFFYITNDFVSDKHMVVYFSNGRADHENDIDQLKNAVGAMNSPSHDLLSNGAFMVIAALAWTLKAWMGLLAPATKPDDRGRTLGDRLLRMEFRTFVRGFITHPCQILRQSRRIICRILGYQETTPDLFRMIEAIRVLRC